jgi:formylglycine-generating enzyme required for sulfatase activity
MIRAIFLIAILTVLFSFAPKNKSFKPPGTVRISDTLFADETEVSNFSWLQFEHWTKVKYGTFSKEHLEVLPDTLVWQMPKSSNEPYVKYYYRHPAYRDYPVVGVSYEQALMFCKWRSERVKEYCRLAGKYQDYEFVYRLPSAEEWESLTFNGQFEFSNQGKDEKGFMKMNVKRETLKKFTDDKVYDSGGVDVTAPVYAYKKNIFGIYNLIGNVAEMTQEKGICKGGGWINSMEECRVGKKQSYDSPLAWLGFRCLCIVRKKDV